MRRQFFAVVMTLALLGGCATQKPSGRLEDVIESHATVTAIDVPQRLITLKDDENGQQIVVGVSDQVRRLNEVKVGDKVVVSYTQAVAWQVKPAGQGAPGVSAQESVTRTSPGEAPGGTVGRKVSLTTTITGIDLANGTVTLTGPGGTAQTIKVREPANLKKVKVGDLVDIVYSEAVAIAVRPVGKQ